MLKTIQVEENIQKCLADIQDSDILIKTLPSNANQYYQDISNKKTIKIIIPLVTANKPNPTPLLRYEILIFITLPNRTKDDEAKVLYSLDETKDEVINLILNNYHKYQCFNSIYFNSYRLEPAEGGMWRAEVNFILEKYAS
ncbi:MAG: hypothetical protein F6K34_01155 [Okeania sp. SIO4D6]|uniref:hypothetical protein n=1 Tax=unclassified Okeania TaxID=2634635 RepID=UPI0013BA5711|nr:MULTISPECIES: hypothetical protein [unclassified Okeania]NEP03537.1 hypothetical protein [Okeania sp. SIO4D6]NEP76011.1 hypothetical protein [Okeania sp. SIO2G5]NEP96599.1 hypothetical protein [Okeania sp. SIO2F5]